MSTNIMGSLVSGFGHKNVFKSNWLYEMWLMFATTTKEWYQVKLTGETEQNTLLFSFRIETGQGAIFVHQRKPYTEKNIYILKEKLFVR